MRTGLFTYYDWLRLLFQPYSDWIQTNTLGFWRIITVDCGLLAGIGRKCLRVLGEVCILKTNRLVPTRMLGGVGAVRENRPLSRFTLILITASLSEAVCPLPLIVTYVLADVNPQLDL